MERSQLLYKITTIALRALIKATNAEIRIHGKENIIDQPVLYVINHFTRMETFFLPYIIHQLTKTEILSLAASEFFGGGFGNYLERLGAVSTNSPDRDRIMTSALLKKDMSCLVFPEGQMIKDKKIIEKGKYMVYNSGIRRPPHTGAAVLALRAEFYRQKLAHFRDTKFNEGIKTYSEFFDIDSKEKLNEVIKAQTHIIPVNVTYYPVRARKNLINKIASKLVGNVPERLEEELAVEGSMLIDGVDIDINFGKAIVVRPFLQKEKIRKMIQSTNTFIEKEEIKNKLRFKIESRKLMYNYMKSIYSMTTVNHDHILSYILSKYKKNKISKKDLRNRAFLAISMMKDQLEYNHSFIDRKQNSLLIDEDNDKMQNFIKALEEDSLIYTDKNYIYKKKERFSRIHQFHTIRKDNIAEVLKNEIEPLCSLVKSLNNIMRVPEFLIRKKIRDKFLKWDLELFERDYKKYYYKKQSKPKNIGQPFFLKKPFSKKGILLIHGYMAAPEEVKELARFLHRSGYSVYGVRLRGHGTSPEDLAARTWQDWLKSVRRGYVILANSVRDMAIGGFSTGAGLALLHARTQEDYNCVISICAPLKLANIASNFASTVVRWNQFLKKINIKKGKMEFVQNNPKNPHINYFKNPVSGLWELEKLMKIVNTNLKDIKIPALVIQGSNDPVVNPESGRDVFEKIGSENKEYVTINSNNHIIIMGEDTKKVFPQIQKFLREFL
ncbi:MAG: alpha/beta fold hydrolase [Spirochaetes bacterium]|nr:alpha/beta fold hydrolase [Spirochaetota bacterium]